MCLDPGMRAARMKADYLGCCNCQVRNDDCLDLGSNNDEIWREVDGFEVF